MCAAWRLTATQVKDRVLKVAFAFAPAVPTNGFIPLATASTYAPVEFGALLRRKEVIQPQVPLRLPCYDFIPVTSYKLGHCFPKVSACTSPATGFHDVTGGVYKTRERIHRTIADIRLLAIPTSRSRVADFDPD